MGLTILEFPDLQYDYICADCGKRHSSFMIQMQKIGFECMYCGSIKLDRIKIIKGGLK